MISSIDISAQAVRSNIQTISQHSGKKFIGVVKANAYGVGMREIVQVADDMVDAWAVDDVSELHTIRFLTDKPVYVLGYTMKEDLMSVCLLRGVQCVYDASTIQHLDSQARIVGEVVDINLKIDALLCRQGVYSQDVEEIIDVIKKCPYVRLRGVYAHFANVEDDQSLDYAHTQLGEYRRALETLKEQGHIDLETHMSASAGALLQIDDFSHVRVGISMYGVWPSPELMHSLSDSISLQPVVTWKTYVAQVKKVSKGQSIGYGRTFIAPSDMCVAVVPQGYSDGYSRLLSNTSDVLIGGKRCRVCGRVAMNMFVVDVTHIPEIRAEDEVVLLGRQGDEEITIEELSLQAQTIPYETLTRLSPLLMRRVV